MKNKIYPDVRLNIVMIHGVWSNAREFYEMARKFNERDDLFSIDARFSVLSYGKLLLFLGRFPFVRT